MNGTDIKEEAGCRSWIEWTPELERELLTPDEILDVRLKSRVMCALIDAREERNISLQDVARMSGVNRSTVTKVAMAATNPSVWTLIRMLRPLGLTLDVVPIPEEERETAEGSAHQEGTLAAVQGVN